MVVVALTCALVGKTGVFGVKIDDSAQVWELKEAIRAKKPNAFKDIDEDKLQLFLAKQPVGDEGGKEVVPVYRPSAEEMKEESLKWLPDEHRAALKLVKGESDDYIHALTAGEPILGSKTLTTWFYTKNNMELPSSEQIHVLVVVPPQDDLRSPALTLLEAILPHVLTSAPTTLTDRNKGFKDELCDFYGCYSRKKSCVRCMLLDVAFPNSLVIASHLFRRSNENVSLVMMQISDIDDVRNGLLLFKPLEHAFDHFQISFIRDDTDTFCLKLFDPSIRDTPLIDLKDRYDNKVLSTEQTELLLRRISSRKKPCRFNVRTTFGDVEGRALTFTGLGRPYNRCLNLQARVARMIALKKDRIDASYDFKDFWSDVSLDEKMKMFQRSIANSNAEF